jgi:hypothetical protein
VQRAAGGRNPWTGGEKIEAPKGRRSQWAFRRPSKARAIQILLKGFFNGLNSSTPYRR